MVKNLLHRAFSRARDFWADLGFVRNQEVIISGLGPEEKAFKQSINDECAKFLAKARKDLREVKRLALHVKSFHKGKDKMYELKASLLVGGTALHASASGRELYAVLRQAFAELLKSSRRLKSLKDVKRREPLESG